MTDFSGRCVAVGMGLALMGLAYGLQTWLRQRKGASDQNAEKLTTLATRLVPAAVVLLLTLPVHSAASMHDGFSSWMQMHASTFRAWIDFWWLVLLIDGMECLLRLFYALRGRPFPLPSLIRNILHFLLVAGALLLVAKTVLGYDISTALASTALLTAVVGFALQGVLGNLLAGMSMHIVRSIVPGDWVAIGDVEGEVLETNWRETRLRTVGGHRLVIPNSKVSDSLIHNMTHPTPLRRISVSVGASYSDAPAEVIATLEAAALSVQDVEREPAPKAVLTAYLDFGINYELRFWTNRYFDRARLISDVQSRIWYQFKRRGIEIPFPMSDKLLNDFMDVVSTQRNLPPKDDQLDEAVSLLKQSDFCRKLLIDADGNALVADEELLPVARLLRRVQYTSGETLFSQGETGEAAYVMVRGRVTGRVDYQSGVAPHTFTLEAGALFGEMSLLTGLPRTATLTAMDEVDLLEIPRTAFVQLLGLRPDIPVKLADLAAQRAAQNAAMYEKLKAMPTSGLNATLQHDSILKRFKRLLER